VLIDLLPHQVVAFLAFRGLQIIIIIAGTSLSNFLGPSALANRLVRQSLASFCRRFRPQ
jgi:hypothetical protein